MTYSHNKPHEVSLKNISAPPLFQVWKLSHQKNELLVYSDMAQNSPLWPLRYNIRDGEPLFCQWPCGYL